MKNDDKKPLRIVWLRRDLRLYDHAAFASALAQEGNVLPVFVFDTDILQDFPNKNDRRVTFIAAALAQMQRGLAEMGGRVLVLHGSARKLIPALAERLGAASVHCAADFEPGTRQRDKAVAEALEAQGRELVRVCDHLIHHPAKVLKADGTPYLVFTPYSKVWRAKLSANSFDEVKVALNGRLATCADETGLDAAKGAENLVKQIGYDYAPHPHWQVEDGVPRLEKFIGRRVTGYAESRDFMAQEEGTSSLSPYLRFGLVSIRHCARLAVEQLQHETWLNELIWREFYAMVLFHFPESQNLEIITKFRDIRWSENEALWEAFISSRTGYPIVDAAMRQLHETGWMHNRARMIVASFLTKDLHLNWRQGEAHFAQWLMDYDMASNVGGWQWAASTGTDAAPYFRIFNPITQSRRFDPTGAYIRRWLPELAKLSDKEIHLPQLNRPASYSAPVVSHDEARKQALAMYRNAGEDAF